LLRRGCRVRGTARDLDRAAALRSFPHATTKNLELVEWKLSDPADVFSIILKDINWIFRAAARMDLGVWEDENEQLELAVTSIQALLRAEQQTPSVSKVVITSSGSAMVAGHGT
jgi:hypothetical protein